MPTPTVRGFHQTDFKFSDNLNFWRRIASGEGADPSVRLFQEKGKEEVAVRELFIGHQQLERASKVIITPLLFTLRIGARKATVEPKSAIELESIDVHNVVTERISKLNEQVVDNNVTVALPDGSIVVGKKISQGPDPGPLQEKKFDHKPVTITYDASSYHENGSFFYTAEVDTSNVNPENPLGFRLTEEVWISDRPIESTAQEYRPIFEVKQGKPLRLQRMEPTRKKSTFHLPT